MKTFCPQIYIIVIFELSQRIENTYKVVIYVCSRRFIDLKNHDLIFFTLRFVHHHQNDSIRRNEPAFDNGPKIGVRVSN